MQLNQWIFVNIYGEIERYTGPIEFVAMACCRNNMDKQERKKEIHVLGFSRFMASSAVVSDVQVLLDTVAVLADRFAGAWI